MLNCREVSQENKVSALAPDESERGKGRRPRAPDHDHDHDYDCRMYLPTEFLYRTLTQSNAGHVVTRWMTLHTGQRRAAWYRHYRSTLIP